MPSSSRDPLRRRGPEGRLVRPSSKWRIEPITEGERLDTGPVVSQALEATGGLLEGRDAPRRNPPEHVRRVAAHRFEPVTATAEEVGVGGPVGVVPQRLDDSQTVRLINRSSSPNTRVSIDAPLSSTWRHTNPGERSPRELIGSRPATNSAISAESIGKRIRAMLNWARCQPPLASPEGDSSRMVGPYPVDGMYLGSPG